MSAWRVSGQRVLGKQGLLWWGAFIKINFTDFKSRWIWNSVYMSEDQFFFKTFEGIHLRWQCNVKNGKLWFISSSIILNSMTFFIDTNLLCIFRFHYINTVSKTQKTYRGRNDFFNWFLKKFSSHYLIPFTWLQILNCSNDLATQLAYFLQL